MGHTITEKILGKACGKEVIPGEIVNVRIDKLMTMDFFASIVGKLYDQLEAPALFDPDMVVVFCDHMGPGHSLKDAELLKQTREFVKKYNLKNFYDLGRNGICHQMMVENGYVKPGKVVVGTDSHSPTYGAMGAFACGVTSSEAAVIMATGEIWFRVPSSVKVELKGKLQPGCCGKDVSLKIMSLIGFDKTALYKAIEITGEGIASLEIADRLTITNMMAETGAKSAIIHADEKTIRYLQDIGADDGDYECYESDSDATYDDEYVINLDELEPTVAIPHSSDLIKKAEELEGTPIHHVFVGSCTNGRLEDIKDAADMVEEHEEKVPWTDLVAVVVIAFGSLLLWKPISFLFAGVLAMMALSIYKKRPILKSLIVSVCTVVVIQLIFRNIFTIPLPTPAWWPRF